jgi:hypothetical protein
MNLNIIEQCFSTRTMLWTGKTSKFSTTNYQNLTGTDTYQNTCTKI